MEKLINEAANKLDDQLDFKKIVGGIAGQAIEWFDGRIFEAGLTFAYAKIPNEYKDEFQLILEAYVSGDYSKVSLAGIQRLNGAIDVPGLDEQEEEKILRGIYQIFLDIVKGRTMKYEDKGTVGGGGPGGDPDGDGG